jgi:hypothetical protein
VSLIAGEDRREDAEVDEASLRAWRGIINALQVLCICICIQGESSY